jgi:hypothetical protein
MHVGLLTYILCLFVCYLVMNVIGNKSTLFILPFRRLINSAFPIAVHCVIVITLLISYLAYVFHQFYFYFPN